MLSELTGKNAQQICNKTNMKPFFRNFPRYWPVDTFEFGVPFVQLKKFYGKDCAI